MAGTRLVVQTLFLVQIVILVLSSLWYASIQSQQTPPSSFSSASPEPFFVDRSGWDVLVEDVSAAAVDGEDGRFMDILIYASEFFNNVANKIASFLEIDWHDGAVAVQHRSGPSVFVEEIRDRVSKLDLDTLRESHSKRGAASLDESRTEPKLVVHLCAPHVDMGTNHDGNHKMLSLAEALERGMKRYPRMEPVSVHIAPLNSSSVCQKSVVSCDEWQMPVTALPMNEKKILFPAIVLMTGCTSVSIPDPYSSIVEVDTDDGTIVVRSLHSSDVWGDSEQGGAWNRYQIYLENDIANTLAGFMLKPVASKQRHTVESVSIHILDEDPMSRIPEKADGFTGFNAKRQFSLLGEALSTSANSVVYPLLNKLSLLYGGDVKFLESEIPENSLAGVLKFENNIVMQVRSSAYLPLPDESIDLESDDDWKTSTKYISATSIRKWIIDHWPKMKSNPNRRSDVIRNGIAWVAFVPSHPHSPLVLYDDVSNEEGYSITLSNPGVDGGKFGDSSIAGLSIVNLDDFNGFGEPGLSPYFDADKNMNPNQIHQHYKQSISHSLVYLVGYIRAVHGLPPSPIHLHAELSSKNVLVTLPENNLYHLSFWELESIARYHWYPTLQQVLYEMDTAMALLRRHSNSLAFPKEVAYRLNNATSQLRHSLTFIEQGLPTIYSTSLLYGALDCIESVTTHPDLMEPSYFAPDHYLAVFSPLILPLTMPMLIGLGREIKRFKELRRKKLS